jgi:prepilin-type N-terminal cleavage/methylation domain-containing protein
MQMKRKMKNMMHKLRCGKAGFSLIEVMMVVGIIAIIVTLAIPTTQAAVRSAKEAGCIKGLKVVYGAIEMYRSEYGYAPVMTSTPSSLFLREIDPFLPEPYHIGHGQNVMIKGYRLFGWVPDNPSSPTFPGLSTSGIAPYDRVGARDWRVIAVPIEPYSGLATFYLRPNGAVSKNLDGKPV